MGYTIAREDLATTTTVPDSLAFVGGQAWLEASGTDMCGIALLKALLYNFQTKVQLPMYHGESGAGQDVTFYGTTAGKNAVWDESDDRLEIVGGADLYLEGSSAANYWLWDGDNSYVRTVGKVDFRYVGSTAANYIEWSAANNRLQTGGKADVKFVGSTSAEYWEFDATADVVQTKGGLDTILEGSSASNYWKFDGDNDRVRTVGKIDFRYVGSTAANLVEWSAADDRLQTGGKADVRFVMSGSDLASGTETNKFEVDATAKLVKMLSYLQVSTVGVSTCTPGDMTVGFYKTAVNSIAIKVDTTGSGNYQYGKWTDTSVAY